MHWTKEASQDVVVGSILDIDSDISQSVGISQGLSSDDVKIVDEWVDSINQEVYHAQEVADDIGVGRHSSSQELYSAVGALRDSIDQNVVEPYWRDVSMRISGFDNPGQLFQGQNFTDCEDVRYADEVISEAYRNPEVLDVIDLELLVAARERRHTLFNLGEAYVHTKNLLKTDEAARAEAPWSKSRSYGDSGL